MSKNIVTALSIGLLSTASAFASTETPEGGDFTPPALVQLDAPSRAAVAATTQAEKNLARLREESEKFYRDLRQRYLLAEKGLTKNKQKESTQEEYYQTISSTLEHLDELNAEINTQGGRLLDHIASAKEANINRGQSIHSDEVNASQMVYDNIDNLRSEVTVLSNRLKEEQNLLSQQNYLPAYK